MGRPAKHTADDFIDAAIALFAANGVRAVTLGAVAERLRAANGSIYHRFPDRPSLLAAIWLRTSSRFEAAYQEQLGRATVASAIAAAVWVVQWCHNNPEQAQVLQAGMRAFDPDSWPLDASKAADSDTDVRAQLPKYVAELVNHTAASAEQIAFTLTDLPLAVVRRQLKAGRAPGAAEVELVRGLATVILRPK